MKRLSLRPYSRWRQQFLKLREAQRTPTHWGLEPDLPARPGCSRGSSREDMALVIGSGASRRPICSRRTTPSSPSSPATSAASSGSSRGWPRRRWAACSRATSRRRGRACPISSTCLAPLDLVVLDPGALAELGATCRMEFIADLQRRSRPGGVHVILPSLPVARARVAACLLRRAGPSRRTAAGAAGPAASRRPDGLVLAASACVRRTRRSGARLRHNDATQPGRSSAKH